MLVLDENFRLEQQAILAVWKIRARKVGRELARYGTGDEDLIPVLHSLASPTFFTHDEDFWRQSLVHRAYCLVWLDLDDRQGALYVRRFLRHPRFDTHAKRAGKVVRVHPDGLTFFDSRHGRPERIAWLRSM